MQSLWQDVRYSCRVLTRNPGFTATIVLILALGIGANTAIFSVVDAVLLKPLPYLHADELVLLTEQSQQWPSFPVAYPNFLDWQRENTVFEQMAAFRPQALVLTGVDEPERLRGRQVSTGFFSTLGVQTALGREFLPEEDRPGADPAVMLSYGLWLRQFGADPGLLGKSLLLDGRSYTVVGIVPPNFRLYDAVDVFVPLGLWADQFANRSEHSAISVVARRKPTTTLEQVRANMDGVAARLEQMYPASNTGNRVRVVPLRETVVGGVRPMILVLFGATGLVLLIACVNVANLLLGRSMARQKEMALRAALGASRWRVTRQLLTESVLLALTGGGLGLLLSVWGCGILLRIMPGHLQGLATSGIGVDGTVALFTAAVSLVTGIFFGLVPALQASAPNLNQALKEAARASLGYPGRQRLRHLLVVSEIALALVLLIGAAVMIRSLQRLSHVDRGFGDQNVLTVQLNLPPAEYAQSTRAVSFYRQLLQRVESLPGVLSTGTIVLLPLSGNSWTMPFHLEGRAAPADGQQPSSEFHITSPGYLRAMGIRLLKGRMLDDSDDETGLPAALVNETFARRHWPNEDPLGQRFRVGPAKDNSFPWLTVVGVVGDTRHGGLANPAPCEFYLCLFQLPVVLRCPPVGPMTLVVHTAVDPMGLAGAVRREVTALDREQAVYGVKTMEQHLTEHLADRRAPMLLLGLFAGLALILASMGVYGVMSYAVSQRTHEIGIRLAMGARTGSILMLVLWQVIRLIVVGLCLGIAAALVLTRLLTSLLFGISPTDPASFIGAAVLLTLVALAASYMPVRRAARIDPMVALRYE